MLKILIAATAGYLMGVLSLKLTRFLVAKRIQNAGEVLLKDRFSSYYIWGILSAVAYVLISQITGFGLTSMEGVLLFSLCLCLSVVDYRIRKIPNELLLALIIIKAVLLVIDYKPYGLIKAIIGFALGIVIFMVPSFLGINIGWGDIKYAAVAGFYLGAVSLLQVIIVMALGLGAYTIYLLVSKRGNLKTAAALGPYISLGIIVTMLFPIIDFI